MLYLRRLAIGRGLVFNFAGVVSLLYQGSCTKVGFVTCTSVLIPL